MANALAQKVNNKNALREAQLSSPYYYGMRYGNNGPKSMGYFGELPIPGESNIATEYSIGVNIGGKNLEIPSIVPTLSGEELNSVLQAAGGNGKIPESVIQKAISHAKERISKGLSPFWEMPEKQFPVPAYNPFSWMKLK